MQYIRQGFSADLESNRAVVLGQWSTWTWVGQVQPSAIAFALPITNLAAVPGGHRALPGMHRLQPKQIVRRLTTNDPVLPG